MQCPIQSSLLQWMSCNSNLLKRIPDSIGQCISLERLSFHINRIEEIPASLGNLSKLEAL